MKIVHIPWYLFLSSIVFVFGCEACSQTNGDGGPPVGSYRAVKAFPNLSFTRPVDFQHAGDNSNRVFVVEQAGVIDVFPNNPSVTEKKTFLDIRNEVDDKGNEEGLLGLAFHPDYEMNGYFYVNYTASNPDRTVIARFKVSSQNPDEADAASELVVLTYAQPHSNHNGGQVSFGPDGYLYIAVGDGGSGGDPHGNGQNRSTLLGTILRIDVDKQEDGNAYGIPPDNPFTNNQQNYREEIYAYGLRNPWRFSFDPVDHRLWVGDVGQNTFEEVDIIEKGGNYGWNIMEAKHCFQPETGCNTSGLKMPVWEYGRKEGVSVTGGFVYRGPTSAGLTGKYVYADYGSRRIWSLDYSDMSHPVNTELLEPDFNISSFGVDDKNELYICAFDGKIYKLERLP
jgi:glucose/arabinose dehydrogenase